SENNCLEETTDREGFKVTPYYKNFYRILEEFVKFTADAQNSLRRSWLDYLKRYNEEQAGVESGAQPEDLSEKIKNSLSKSSACHIQTEELKILLSENVFKAQETIGHITEQLPPHINHISELRESVSSLGKHITEANELAGSIDEYLQELSTVKGVESLLDDKLKSLREQSSQLFELAGLGLTT
ncbi:MAG: hypothetical protein GY816_02725, partial [Cytophagales bacterium]|nr:hypothetical protein [Cytophagales bacterium]